MSTQAITKQPVSYLSQLLERRPTVSLSLDDNTTAWLNQVRDRASAWTHELAIPTTRDEDWRFTDLSPLLQVSFESARAIELSEAAIATLILPETRDSRLVFVNGTYAPNLSSTDALPDGVYVGNLANLPQPYRDRAGEYLGQQEGGKEVFTALNTASFSDAAVVWVARNTIVETPIQLLFISATDETPTLSHPRCLVVAERSSSVTLVEQYTSTAEGCPDSPSGSVYFTNPVTEVWVNENARVDCTRLQRDAGDAFHIGKTAVSQARDSYYACHTIDLGAKLSRHNLEVYQTGEGTNTRLNGLTLVSGKQLADTHSLVACNYPNGTADQLHKCIIADKAHSVFNGRLCVPKPAQLTNASQLNRNLLLSPKARANTKPQLEIVADNVKCSHGATVSQLDEDEVFYLQSRGLDRQHSRNLLIDAFAADILNRVPVETIRHILAQCVACRID